MTPRYPTRLAFALAALLCMPSWSAELGLGDALSPQTAVRVLAADSEADLYDTVTAWVTKRFPEARFVQREFQYIADDRALLILWTIGDAGTRKPFYFETPGLPVQFVGRRR
jgi:hypothetical protein